MGAWLEELWGVAPAGESQSRMDASPWEWLPSGSPQQKLQQLLLAQAEWELRESEQRVGGKKSCLQKEGDLGHGPQTVSFCRTHASKNGEGDGATS